MELLVSQVSGKVGDTITIVGQVTNAPSCSSYRVIMTYDGSCLQALSGTKGSGTSGQASVNINAQYQSKNAVVALAASTSSSV